MAFRSIAIKVQEELRAQWKTEEIETKAILEEEVNRETQRRTHNTHSDRLTEHVRQELVYGRRAGGSWRQSNSHF